MFGLYILAGLILLGVIVFGIYHIVLSKRVHKVATAVQQDVKQVASTVQGK
jgi:sensor domain CHASE-containing protein